MIADILILIWVHFTADFILQTDYVAINKSESNSILTTHVVLYIIPFIVASLFLPLSSNWMIFNAVAHWIVDYCSCRATGYFWERNQRHWFFVVIGLDQALHMTCLVWSYSYL